MGFATDIEKESVEKISLAVISPRKRITGWTLDSTDVYSAPFTLGRVSAVWGYFDNDAGFTEASGPTPGIDEFYHDAAAGILYIGASDNPDTDVLLPIPGLTVQFDVYLASSYQSGYRNPRDAATDVVDWEGKLLSIPLPKSGSVDDIFGFQPINIDAIRIANDGWLNEILHEVSWINAPVAAYLLTGTDFQSAFDSAGVRQVYSGYTTGVSESGNVVSVQCTDYLKSLDREYDFNPDWPQVYSIADFPNIDPEAVKSGREWRIRRIYGRVDALTPVNADYSITPSETNNRDWLTHADEGETFGSVLATMDHLAANTSTRTYFIDPPPFNKDDALIFRHSSNKYGLVTAVDRDLKYIDHTPITRTVLAGEQAERLFVGNVCILDRAGNYYQLMPERDYNELLLGGVRGFSLVDNLETSFGFINTPFDPAQDSLVCRVYGTKNLQQYSDSTDVLSVSENTGVASRAGNLIFRLLTRSGIPVDLIDKASFESAAGDSHTMGLVIPDTRDGLISKTYKEIISDILASSLLKLTLINDAGSGIYIGLSAVGPFQTSGDFEISDQDYSDFSWEHDYSGIYSEVIAQYRLQDTNSFAPLVPPQNEPVFVNVENAYARHVHFISRKYEVALLQMDPIEAAQMANRIAFILSDRRGIYRFSLPQSFISKAAIGVSFLTNRNHLPGFVYDRDIQRQRTLAVVEVQKNIDTIQVTLDDQLGIQTNSGDW